MTPCVGSHSERSEESIFRPVFRDDRPRTSCNPILEKAFFDMEVSPSSYAPRAGLPVKLSTCRSSCNAIDSLRQGSSWTGSSWWFHHESARQRYRVNGHASGDNFKFHDAKNNWRDRFVSNYCSHRAKEISKKFITGHFWRISNLFFFKKFHFPFDPIKIIL